MKSFISKIVFVTPFLFSVSVFAQTSLDIEEERQYEQYTKPSSDSAGKAFQLWQNARDGYVKGYNVDSLLSVYHQLAFHHRLRQLEFIRQHPASLVSLKYFDQYFVSSPYYKVDSLLALYGQFDKELKTTSLGKSVAETLHKKLTLSIGNEMPTFSFKTNLRKQVSLSSLLEDKYVLLAFWDAGCRPCIRTIPLLKSLYQKYEAKGLEIISVSIDNDEKTWLAALDKYGMPWLQTCDLGRYIDGRKRVRDVYDIAFIPQYFLIDKKGRLIYQNVLLDEQDDYSLLQAILQRELNVGSAD